MMLKAAREHLEHGAVIVRLLYRPDLEFAIVRLVGLAVDENDHSGHRGRPAQIRIVEAFDASRQTLQVKPFLQPSQHIGPGLPGGPFFAGRLVRVLGRHFDQALLVPPLRAMDSDPLLAPGAEPVLQ